MAIGNYDTNKEELENLKNEIHANPKIVSGMDNPVALKPLGLRGRAVFRQVSMVFLANLSIISTGMGLGYPAVALQQLTDPTEPFHLTSSQASWFASINAIACPLGGLLSGYLLDKIGRKRTIISINLTSMVAWGLMAFAYNSDPDMLYAQMMVSRFLIGVATGLASSPAGVYSAESCHPNLRGRLTLGTSIATATGILAIYTLGYFIRNDWRLISLITMCYATLTLILTIPIPESPSWLMAKKRPEEARAALKFFRGIKKSDNSIYEEFETEFTRLEKSLQLADGAKKPQLRRMIKKPEVYKPLLIMIGFFGCQQFSGIFVVIVYAVQFSIEAGVEIDPILCAILIGLTRVLTTFLVGVMLDKWGRRPPAMVSGLGMAVCMVLLAATTWFPWLASIPYLPVGCIVMYIFTSTMGLMTLPFSMIAEVYPQRVRGAAAGLTICCGYLMSFTIVKSYPAMVSSMGNENVFAFYGAVSLLAVGYVYCFLPETKGKSLLEIEEYFKYGASGVDTQKEVEMRQVFVKK